MRLADKYLKYLEGKTVPSYWSISGRNAILNYIEREDLAALLKVLSEENRLTYQQCLQLTMNRFQSGVLRKKLLEDLYLAANRDNLAQVEEYRRRFPDGPPEGTYLNTSIKDKDWKELCEELGPQAERKTMIDHWCRNPAGERHVRDQAEHEYETICRWLTETVLDFFNDLPVIETIQRMEHSKAGAAYRDWPHEKKLIVSGRKDRLSVEKIDKAVRIYQRKTGKPHKYHSRNRGSLFAIHSRVVREAKDKALYDLVESGLCDPYLA